MPVLAPGEMHLLTVLGATALVCLLVQRFFKPYLERDQYYYLKDITLIGAWALCGIWSQSPLLRATIMLLFLVFYFLRGRPHTTLDILCAALLCISLASPLSVLDTGLQLSVLCVAVIGMSLPWLRVLAPEPDAAPPAQQPGRCSPLRC